MKVIIEIEKEEDLNKIKKIFKKEKITVVNTQAERKNLLLESLFKKYNIKLPKNFKLNREEIHAR